MSALISFSGPCVVKNDFDAFCNFCIAVMTALAKSWGVTYGTANVVLFVILMPLIIVLFFVAALFKRRNKWTNICFYFGIVITVVIMFTLMAAFLDTLLQAKD